MPLRAGSRENQAEMQVKTEDFFVYYRTETNRRLQSIETDLKILMNLRTQIVLVSLLASSGISLVATGLITYFFKKL